MSESPSFIFHPVAFAGACLCGEVRFGGTDLRDVVLCHCKQCLHSHGAVAAYAATDRESLVIKPNTSLSWFHSSPSVRRGFCKRCGSNLFWSNDKLATVCVAASALERQRDLSVVAHVFAGRRYMFDDIADDLPRFRESMHTQQ